MKSAIFDKENWREIAATLSRNKTRTFLTGFGIFWGVAMLTLLLGGARGGSDLIRRNFAGFTTNSCALIPNITGMPYKGMQKGTAWSMTAGDVEMIRHSFPELKSVVPSVGKWGSSFSSGKNSYSGQVVGVESNYTDIVQPQIFCGRFISEADIANSRKVIVLGRKVAGNLFPDDDEPLGKTVVVNGVAFRVVGVAGDVSDISINGRVDESGFMPISSFRSGYGVGDKIDVMMMVAADGERLGEVLPSVRKMLARRHGISPDDESAFYEINVAEMFEKVDNIFLGVDLLAFFIGFSTLVAGIIGIGNIMWVIVKERTQEIGIRRAIGAKPSDIIVQVLCEGAMLTFVAGMAGLVFAVGILAVLHSVNNPEDTVTVARFQMTVGKALSILALFLTLGIVAGIVPSVKAMRIKPVEAINSK